LKWTPPRYQDIGATKVTLLSSHDGGALVRVIAGDVAGHAGPGITHTPIALVHATVNPGAELRIPWRAGFNGLVYVLAGRGTVGAKRAPIGFGQLAAFGDGDLISLTADLAQESRSRNLEVLILGGEPIGEPVAWYGPFVMNTHEELAQAFDDYRRGRMGTIPAAHIGT
jgi:redox-sensitive bicupin YhaK (pirin superfamily)